MIIANPIYDTVFKFLLEDTTVAKQLISAIIGEEILDLETKPQEQTVPSNRFLLTVYRVDFKAVIKMASGGHKKVLIELQKSSHPFDIMRFRHYLGSNYTKDDVVEGVATALPIVPIYFLGFNLSVKRPVLKIARSYVDVGTGETLADKDPFIEQLSHDCFVIQLLALPRQTRTRLEKLLSVFNQRYLFDEDQKWLLQHPGSTDDQELRPLLRRLSVAAESDDVREQIRVEEQFDRSMERALREQERIIEQKEAVIMEKEAVIEQKEAVIEQKEAVIEQKEAVIEQKEAMIAEQRLKNEELLRRLAELERKMK
ncbi:MAG TPA: hypothetical protein PK858_04285 [Saprospiraceae bacterium]|nr:hypothetical protein [Saprospiraceae bacterium]